MKKLFWIVLFLPIACNTGEKQNYVLTPLQFKEKLAATPQPVLLDVRTLDEVRKEHLKGIINLDFNSPSFGTLVQGLDKNQTYFVYCAAGTRSAKAADMMRDMGFKTVYQLEGGINAWKAAGLETVVKE